MSDTPPSTPDVEYGDFVISRALGATITSFGANADGEIYLSAVKNGLPLEIIIGIDPEDGGVALFEVEKQPPTPEKPSNSWNDDFQSTEGVVERLCRVCPNTFFGNKQRPPICRLCQLKLSGDAA